MDKSIFGKNLKYILVLTALSWIVYTLPTVRAAISNVTTIEVPSVEVSMLDDFSSQVMAAVGSLSNLPQQPSNCPSGYVCILKSLLSSWCPPGFQCIAQKPEIVSFSASPSVVSFGSKVSLSWSSRNTDYCVVSGAGKEVRQETSKANYSVGPFKTSTELTLVCGSINPSQRVSSSTKITVASETSSQQLVVSNASVSKMQDIAEQANGPIVAAAFAYSFTLTNIGSEPVYVKSDVNKLITGFTTSPAGGTSYFTGIEPVAPVSGDSPSTYIISPQASRSFVVDGLIKKIPGKLQSVNLRITQITYYDMPSTKSMNIVNGLEKLSASIVL